MKVTIEIDCTPDEARQLMGLPDVKPMQAALMARVETQMAEAVERFAPDALLGTWLSLVPPGADGIRSMMERFFKAASPQPGSSPPRGGSGP